MEKFFAFVRKKKRQRGEPARNLRNKEDFAGIRVLHLLSGSVAINVDISATRIEWTENVPWFPRHRFGRGILGGLSGGGPRRWTGRRLRLFRRRDSRGGSGRRIWSRLILRRYLALGVAIRRRHRDRAARRRHRVRRNRGARGGRFRLRAPIDSIPNIAGRRVDYAERSDRHIMRRAAPAKHEHAEQKNPSSRFHAGNLSGIEPAAREFLHSPPQRFTSLTKSSMSCSETDHEHINR
jgi:hypothetical protein